MICKSGLLESIFYPWLEWIPRKILTSKRAMSHAHDRQHELKRSSTIIMTVHFDANGWPIRVDIIQFREDYLLSRIAPLQRPLTFMMKFSSLWTVHFGSSYRGVPHQSVTFGLKLNVWFYMWSVAVQCGSTLDQVSHSNVSQSMTTF